MYQINSNKVTFSWFDLAIRYYISQELWEAAEARSHNVVDNIAWRHKSTELTLYTVWFPHSLVADLDKTEWYFGNERRCYLRYSVNIPLYSEVTVVSWQNNLQYTFAWIISVPSHLHQLLLQQLLVLHLHDGLLQHHVLDHRLRLQGCQVNIPYVRTRISIRAWSEGYPKVRKDFTITEKAPTRAFSWLKAPTTGLLALSHSRHY